MTDPAKNRVAKTHGCHHIGLSVSKLEATADFFIDILGWQEVRRDETYPAVFVSDGHIMVTLWQSRSDDPVSFDKNNIGLHHVAFMVDTEDDLNTCYEKIRDAKLKIEFSPELLRDGPAKHMICYEPGGIRIELIWLGQ
jgi:catechol 2,3-dioxygenase-like lactoylglutathione lyase family enzyme